MQKKIPKVLIEFLKELAIVSHLQRFLLQYLENAKCCLITSNSLKLHTRMCNLGRSPHIQLSAVTFKKNWPFFAILYPTIFVIHGANYVQFSLICLGFIHKPQQWNCVVSISKLEHFHSI